VTESRIAREGEQDIANADFPQDSSDIFYLIKDKKTHLKKKKGNNGMIPNEC